MFHQRADECKTACNQPPCPRPPERRRPARVGAQLVFLRRPGHSDTGRPVVGGCADRAVPACRRHAATLGSPRRGGGLRCASLVGSAPRYSAPFSLRLVEREEVAFIGGPLGTPTNSAVQKYLNAKKVPQLFLVSAASKWNDPAHYPWSMSFAWGPNYYDEGRIHAKYLLTTRPGIKAGVLYQNDDGGQGSPAGTAGRSGRPGR